MPPDSSSSDERPERWLPRIAPLLPAILLTAVALNQIRLVHLHDLGAWKGGGFGMFSTGEGGGSRHTHLFVTDAGSEREVDLPDDLEDLEERLLVLPTDARLERFARELSDALAEDYPDHSAVRVEIWHTRYRVEDLSPETHKIRDYRIGADP